MIYSTQVESHLINTLAAKLESEVGEIRKKGYRIMFISQYDYLNVLASYRRSGIIFYTDDKNNENAGQSDFTDKKVETILLSGLPRDELKYQVTTQANDIVNNGGKIISITFNGWGKFAMKNALIFFVR